VKATLNSIAISVGGESLKHSAVWYQMDTY